MISFQPMSLTERIKRLWPAYRRRRDEEMKEAIRQLLMDPDEPCLIGNSFIPDGRGSWDAAAQSAARWPYL